MNVAPNCFGKAVYRSKGEAIICLNKRLKGGARVNVGPRANGLRLRPYQCRTCHHWHIGSSL